MRVLQVNNVYGVGSTGKLTQILHMAMLEDGMNSSVLYGRGPDAHEKGVIRICSNLYGKVNSLISRFTGIPYGGCWSSTKKIIRIIQEEQPDVVHLQCINGNFVNIYRLISWLKERKIPTVLTLHAEFMYTANCSHAFDCELWKTGCGRCPRRYKATKSLFFDRTHRSFLKMADAFCGFDTTLKIVSVSPWLMKRAKSAPILSKKDHRTIMNGIDTEVFHPRDTIRLSQKHNTSHKKVIFHATAMFRDMEGDPKGGQYILQLAQRMRQDPVLFVVAGKYMVHGAVPDNVVLLGEIRNQELLAQYYSLADLTVLTSKRETYSMVCAESLCCGTPVAGFQAGAPEEIALPQYSCFVSNGDLDALENAVRGMLASSYKRLQIAETARETYAKEKMVRQYEALYREVICSKQN